MVKLTNKNLKVLSSKNQSLKAFVKASNILLEPFSTLERGEDHKAANQLKIPPNSKPQVETIVKKKELVSLVAFCKRRNIPFNENEQRFYRKEKSKL